MEEWKTYKLGQIAKIQTGPFGSQLHQADYVDEGIPCIMPVNIGNGLSLLPDGIAKVTEDDANRLLKHRVKAGDIVYSRRGDIERCAFISQEQEGWLCGTGCLRVCDFSPEINPKFIAYCLSLPAAKAWLVSNAVGTTMLNLNTSILSEISLAIPDYNTQNKIVSIIDCFDSKISINSRINHNLEEQAQALYKSWFVELEPFKDGKFVESELGMIPEGWHIGTVEDLSTRIASGGTPKSMNAEYYSGSINWFSTKELKDCFLFSSEKHITSDAVNNSAAKLFPSGTVLMAIYAAPTVGRLGILNNESTFNQAAVGIIPRIDVGAEFIYLTLLSERDNLNNLASGAAQQNLNVGIVKNYKIVVPPTFVLEAFKEAANPIFQTIKTHSEENTILCSSRDNLLPRLMSGEITC